MEFGRWQRAPASERIRAVSELTTVLYALKGQPAHVQRLQRTLVRIKRPPGYFFRIGTPPVMVDILSRIGGVEFEGHGKGKSMSQSTIH
jgi:hypothetical protein